MLFVFLGPPGSGKGTQSKILEKKYQLTHLSTGDILRNEKNSKLGKLAQEYMKKGQLIPDDIIINLVTNRIFVSESRTIILDGFPRTKMQAIGLDSLLKKKGKKLDKLIYFYIDKKDLVSRLAGRIINKKTGEIYHAKYNPPPENIDNQILIRRQDDGLDQIATRLDIYEKKTMPIIDYYQEKNILLKIDAKESIDIIHQELVKQLSL